MQQDNEHDRVVNEETRPDEAGELEALGKAQQFLREADAHILLRTYKPVGSLDYEHLTQETRKCMMLARVAISQALTIEEDAE